MERHGKQFAVRPADSRERHADTAALAAREVLSMLNVMRCSGDGPLPGRRRTPFRIFPIAMLLLLVSTFLLAQDQPAPFVLKEVNSQLVIQTVTVTDKNGKSVEALTKDDFLLTEDNIPQTISVFEFEK